MTLRGTNLYTLSPSLAEAGSSLVATCVLKEHMSVLCLAAQHGIRMAVSATLKLNVTHVTEPEADRTLNPIDALAV